MNTEKKREREKSTVGEMIALYCRKNHGGKPLCPECKELKKYAETRSDKCPFMCYAFTGWYRILIDANANKWVKYLFTVSAASYAISSLYIIGFDCLPPVIVQNASELGISTETAIQLAEKVQLYLMPPVIAFFLIEDIGISIAGLKRQYKSYGLLMKLMKIVPYSWIRKMLISVSKKQVGLTNEPEQDKKYMEDFFAWVYRNYTKEFDIHMTTLMTDTAKLKPMTKEDYARYDKKTLLVLPLNDEAFPQEAQQELMEMLPNAHTVRVTGGHTSTLYKVGKYVAVTKEFIKNFE